jgi:hypothetical protein
MEIFRFNLLIYFLVSLMENGNGSGNLPYFCKFLVIHSFLSLEIEKLRFKDESERQTICL